jgi:hypothetical protein
VANSRFLEFLRQLAGYAKMLALVFTVIILGAIVLPITGLDRLIEQYESGLTATTIGTTALGFALFMSDILYRIFGGGGERMSHADVEEQARRVAYERRPAFARASTYRFKGESADSSFHDEFSMREAKGAWKQRAWRGSLRWRGNFVIMGGAFLLVAFGLFGIFVVVGSNGIKLLCGGAIVYAAVRTIVVFMRA